MVARAATAAEARRIRPGTWPGGVAAAGALGAVLAAVVVGLMHLVPPWSVNDPVRRTISEYALREGGWLFDAAVSVLALGSAAVLAALVGARMVRPRSLPAVLITVWNLGLLLVVVFEKTNWSIGPSVSGYIHRWASIAAFVALPVAALMLARRWRLAGGPSARAIRVVATLALVMFAPIVLAVATQGVTGVPWYRAVPLGLVERSLALSDVVVVVLLGRRVVRAAAGSVPARTAA